MFGWLRDRWHKLIIILDYYWHSLYDLVRKGANWFLTRINNVWYQAWDTIIRYYHRAKAAVSDARSWLWGKILHYYNLARAAVDTARSWLWSQIIRYYNLAISAIGSARSWLQGRIIYYWNQAQGLFAQLRDWALTQVRGAINKAQRLFEDAKAWAQRAIKAATGGIKTIAETAKGSINNFRQTWEGPLTNWFSDPTAIVWGIIEAHLLEFAIWFLAKLLGSEGRELDNPRPNVGVSGAAYKPDWNQTYQGGNFARPTPGWTITQYYAPQSGHYGLDVGLEIGTPVKSIAPGTVLAAGWSSAGYGFYCDVEHPDGWWSRYAHFSQLMVSAGQHVERGTTLGLGGSTGNSSGPHLHIEIKKDGNRVDPLAVLP
jgi:murein DD-endopeptidase MepM/ murein hydrolase activator NlpD